MSIGQHQPLLGVEDHARALAPLAERSRIAKQVAQHRVKQGRVERLGRQRTLGVNAHHRRRRLPGGSRHKAVNGGHGLKLSGVDRAWQGKADHQGTQHAEQHPEQGSQWTTGRHEISQRAPQLRVRARG